MKLDLINFKQGTENYSIIPDLFRLSKNLKVSSHFRQIDKGLQVSIEGNPKMIEDFLEGFQDNSVSKKDNTAIEINRLLSKGLCRECLDEIIDPNNRRYGYYLNGCNNCGPNIAYVNSLPLKRENSSFSNLIPCERCQDEITANVRRYEFPFISCPECGPNLMLLDGNKDKVPSENIISKCAYLINRGEILALKTAFGFCLALNAISALQIEKLNNIEHSNLEIVFQNIDSIKRFIELTTEEESLITGFNTLLLKPIVASKINSNLSSQTAQIGIRLAQIPLEHLLLRETGNTFLIFTKAGDIDDPPFIENNLAIESLKDQIDYFLVDDLPLANAFQNNSYKKVNQIIIKVSPSFQTIAIPSNKTVLALGDENNSALALSNGKETLFMPVTGKLSSFQSLKQFKDSYYWLKRTAPSLDLTVISNKPNSKIERFAGSQGLNVIKTQHHHAHAVSVMVENNLTEKVLAVIFDSGGYMDDEHLTGAEFLLADRESYQRIAYLEPFDLPGAEICTEEPWRIALSLLYKAFGDEFFPYPQLFRDISQREISLVLTMLKQKVNCLSTNSMSTILNGLTSMIGLMHKNSRPNENFEMFSTIDSAKTDSYINKIELPEIKLTPIIKQIYGDTFIKSTVDMTGQIRETIAELTLNILTKLKKRYRINKIVLSGDFFEEGLLLNILCQKLKRKRFETFLNKELPFNDYNIPIGQIGIALSGRNGDPAA